MQQSASVPSNAREDARLCDICPVAQLRLCAAAWRRPSPAQVTAMAADLGGSLVDINDRAVVVAGLDEPPRYLTQHTLGFQAHDVAKPHHYRRHGRVDVGWPASDAASRSSHGRAARAQPRQDRIKPSRPLEIR